MSFGLESIGLQSLGLDAGQSGAGSTDPEIVDVTAGETSAVVTYTGIATHYRLDGGSSVAIGASPATITGLTVNTEYSIELTGDGSTWSAAVTFGTLNPGEGGGSFATTVTATATLGAAVQAAASGSASLSAAVQQALALQTTMAAAIQAGRSTQALLDAYVQAGLQVNALLSAAIQASASVSAGLSAYITDSSAPTVIGARSGSAVALRPTRGRNVQAGTRSN